MPDSHPLVCRFGALGDMVLVTPLLRQLYQRSGLPCDVVGVGAWNQKLFAQMPYVRDVYSIDSRSAPYWFNPSQRELVRNLRQRQHRFIWICETNRKSYRLLRRAGIERANTANQLDLEPVASEHYCDKWLRLGNLSPAEFEPAPLADFSTATELFVSAAEKAECQSWLQNRQIGSNSPLVCIQAGSKRTTRRGRANRASNSKYWHERNWAAVIDQVTTHLQDSSVLLCGVPAESDMCHAIKSLCVNPERVHNVADELPLRRLLALLSLAHSCISVDTGPAHIAAALNCPLVVLFGKANPQRFRPVADHAAVKIIQGFANATQTGATDIGNIHVQQVFDAWLDANPQLR